jgi:hypothetical protein
LPAPPEVLLGAYTKRASHSHLMTSRSALVPMIGINPRAVGAPSVISARCTEAGLRNRLHANGGENTLNHREIA